MELKPCPFCGSSDLETYYGSIAFVRCKTCLASGPVMGLGQQFAESIDRENSRTGWNKRTGQNEGN